MSIGVRFLNSKNYMSQGGGIKILELLRWGPKWLGTPALTSSHKYNFCLGDENNFKKLKNNNFKKIKYITRDLLSVAEIWHKDESMKQPVKIDLITQSLNDLARQAWQPLHHLEVP